MDQSVPFLSAIAGGGQCRGAAGSSTSQLPSTALTTCSPAAAGAPGASRASQVEPRYCTRAVRFADHSCTNTRSPMSRLTSRLLAAGKRGAARARGASATAPSRRRRRRPRRRSAAARRSRGGARSRRPRGRAPASAGRTCRWPVRPRRRSLPAPTRPSMREMSMSVASASHEADDGRRRPRYARSRRRAKGNSGARRVSPSARKR